MELNKLNFNTWKGDEIMLKYSKRRFTVVGLEIILICFISIICIAISLPSKENEYAEDIEEIMEYALEESDLRLEQYLDIEGLNLNVENPITYTNGKLSMINNVSNETSQYEDVTMKEAILDIYDDMSDEEKEILKEMATEDKEISNLVELLENKFEDDIIQENAECGKLSNNKVSKLSAGLAALGSCLAGVGLNSTAIAAIKGAFSAMLTALKLWFTPTVVKAAIAVAAILVITVVIVVNWDKVEGIFDAIVDFFVESAGKIAAFVKNAMTTIYNKAIESTIVLYKWVDGIKVGFRYLTRALADKLSNQLDRGKYLIVLDIKGGQPIQCSTKIYTKKQTMAQLKLDNTLSCYTPKSNDAYIVLRDAFPTFSVTHSEIGANKGWQFSHYHVRTGFDETTGKEKRLGNIHSLYGLPTYVK